MFILWIKEGKFYSLCTKSLFAYKTNFPSKADFLIWNYIINFRWRCNICYRVNDLPEEFLYDPVSKSYGDPSRRPECKVRLHILYGCISRYNIEILCNLSQEVLGKHISMVITHINSILLRNCVSYRIFRNWNRDD